ncbi:hypothetical protein A3715_15480 [Oleiphilus sp. HI0009]|nr:hypothetical protein A3715_15480 [Oleiphilus sp. HI0009]
MSMYGDTKVVAVNMQKGGVGKTTISIFTALHAANTLAKKTGKYVLLIDFDEQQSLSRALLEMSKVPGASYYRVPVHPEYNETKEDIEEEIQWSGKTTSMDMLYGNNQIVPYGTKIHERIDVIPSDAMLMNEYGDEIKNYKGSNLNLSGMIRNALKDVLQKLAATGEYCMIIIDTPPANKDITKPILEVATHVIAPFEMGPETLEMYQKETAEIESINQSGVREEPLKIAGLIPNKFKKTQNLDIAFYNNIKNGEKRPEFKDALTSPLESRVDIQYQILGLKKDGKLASKDPKARASIQRVMKEIFRNMAA